MCRERFSSLESPAVHTVCKGEPQMNPMTIIENERIIVLQAQLGEWDNLNHLIVCQQTNQAVIVDPFDGAYWQSTCAQHGWVLDQVWLTHSHWDHAKGVDALKQALGGSLRVQCHALERERGWEGAVDEEWHHQPNSHVKLKCGLLEFEAHCTPGHTPGHTTFIGEGLVISGDCLFLGRCGRTDLYGGDPEVQRSTLHYLRHQMQQLDKTTVVLPGHQYQLSDGQTPTTMKVGEVLRTNEALLALDDDKAWTSLPFLAFDDSMAEKARRKRSQDS